METERVHERIINTDDGLDTVEIVVIGRDDDAAQPEVFLNFSHPSPGSPATCFHITSKTANALAALLVRAAGPVLR